MNIDRRAVQYLSVYAIIIALFNLISFVIPFDQNDTFWIAYTFAMIAFVGVLLVFALALVGKKDMMGKFYSIPILRKGFLYVAVQFAVTVVFYITTLFTDDIPSWFVIVLNVFLLGGFAVFILLTSATRDTVEKIEKDTDKETETIRTFRIDTASLTPYAKDENLKTVLHRLEEIAKYSDPVSSPALEKIEGDISFKIYEISEAMRNDDNDLAIDLTKQTCKLFEQRNAMCKAYKHK